MSPTTTPVCEMLLGLDRAGPRLMDWASGRAALFTARSPLRDDANQDGALFIELPFGAVVVAVSDGCGGLPAGADAAAASLRALRDAVLEVDRPEAMTGAIVAGFDRANRAVLDLRVGAGATLSVVEIYQDRVRPYHAGDSMILLTGQRGRRKLQTIAHGPVAYAVEAGVLSEDDALMHAERSIVSNIVGTEDMRVDIGPSVPLSLRDTLVVASDGLSDNLYPGEIVEIVRTGALEAAAAALVDRCAGRMASAAPGQPGHPDDLTFILLRPA